MDTPKSSNSLDHKLYKRRWFMLGLFMMHTFNGAQLWPQFTIINNLVTKYYDASPRHVEWMTNIFALMYMVLVVPSLYLIDILGVRYIIILSALGITVGNWIKVFSVSPDRFYLAFIGQACSAAFFMLSYGLPGRFTALWFGRDEISIAGVLSLLGNQVGIAVAFFIPANFVLDGSKDKIGRGLRNMHLTICTTSTTVLILILLFFHSRPKLPPSVSQLKQQQMQQERTLKTLSILIKKPSFILFLLSYGLNIACYLCIATFLNELVTQNYPDATTDAGRIGALMVVSGITSSIFIGRFLDRTRLFKESAVFLIACSALTMIMFTWSLKSKNILYVYLSRMLAGFFIMGNYTTGIQLGIELTYPISEQISIAITLLSGQAFAFVLTILFGLAIKSYGDLYSNAGIVVLHIIAAITALFVPSHLERQKAENEPKEIEER